MKLNFTPLDEHCIENVMFKRWGTVLEPKTGIPVLGFDPGKNLGWTYISPNGFAYLHYGVLPKCDPTYAIANTALDVAINVIIKHPVERVVIEGASFGDKYGQVLLAYIRIALWFGCLITCQDVQIVPPTKIRREVFGSGKVNSKTLWPKINHNAADSLAIAMYAGGYKLQPEVPISESTDLTE